MQSSGTGHALGSTRAGGQDDGSLHKLPQTTSRKTLKQEGGCPYLTLRVFVWGGAREGYFKMTLVVDLILFSVLGRRPGGSSKKTII